MILFCATRQITMCILYRFVFVRSHDTVLNTQRPRQNGRHFAHDIFKRTFLNENFRIPIEMSLKFVPKSPINNIPALVLIMGWHRPGDKSLSEPMVVRLPTHACVARPQWVQMKITCYIMYLASLIGWIMDRKQQERQRRRRSRDTDLR